MVLLEYREKVSSVNSKVYVACVHHGHHRYSTLVIHTKLLVLTLLTMGMPDKGLTLSVVGKLAFNPREISLELYRL